MFNTSSPRNWFPVILAGLTIALAFGFYLTKHSLDVSAWKTWIPGDRDERISVPSAVTEEEYQAAVKSIYATYLGDKDAQSAYDAFIQLHVPASMQTFHIDLIIAFGKLAGDNTGDGEARLNALLAQNTWLSL